MRRCTGEGTAACGRWKDPEKLGHGHDERAAAPAAGARLVPPGKSQPPTVCAKLADAARSVIAGSAAAFRLGRALHGPRRRAPQIKPTAGVARMNMIKCAQRVSDHHSWSSGKARGTLGRTAKWTRMPCRLEAQAKWRRSPWMRFNCRKAQASYDQSGQPNLQLIQWRHAANVMLVFSIDGKERPDRGVRGCPIPWVAPHTGENR